MNQIAVFDIFQIANALFPITGECYGSKFLFSAHKPYILSIKPSCWKDLGYAQETLDSWPN
jgi:hypothetical protein